MGKIKRIFNNAVKFLKSGLSVAISIFLFFVGAVIANKADTQLLNDVGLAIMMLCYIHMAFTAIISRKKDGR